MSDKLKQTMKILRSSKVRTDSRGRTVWVDPVETAKLELVSTQMLKKIIASGDDDTNSRLRQIAENENGLLARDVDKNRFEVISDTELQRILDGTDEETETADRADAESAEEASGEEEALELVSTQMLRVILEPGDGETSEPDPEDAADAGFNPYDSA